VQSATDVAMRNRTGKMWQEERKGKESGNKPGLEDQSAESAAATRIAPGIGQKKSDHFSVDCVTTTQSLRLFHSLLILEYLTDCFLIFRGYGMVNYVF
jgi:hypothetical protein